MRIRVESRIGNAVLGILGVVYAAAGIALLASEVVQVWGAASLTDYAVAFVLLASISTGGLFIVTAVRNLGVRPQRRESLPHPEAAATVR